MLIAQDPSFLPAGPFAMRDRAEIEHPVLRLVASRTAQLSESPRGARQSWDDAVELGEQSGYRNAQATVLAPTSVSGGGMRPSSPSFCSLVAKNGLCDS